MSTFYNINYQHISSNSRDVFFNDIHESKLFNEI